MENTIARGIC